MADPRPTRHIARSALGVLLLAVVSSPALAVGVVEFGTLPIGRPAYPEAVSADGQITVGWGKASPNVNRTDAYRRAADGTLEHLAPPPGDPGLRQIAFGVSSDGDVVVGVADTSSGNRAFRWTAETGMAAITSVTAQANDVSADGSAVGGWWFPVVGGGRNPFIWTEASGAQILEPLTPDLRSYAYGTSDDGLLTVGAAYADVGGSLIRRPVMWDASGQITELQPLTGATSSVANGASYDGSIIAGTTIGGPQARRATFWTAPDAPHDLALFLIRARCRPRRPGAAGSHRNLRRRADNHRLGIPRRRVRWVHRHDPRAFDRPARRTRDRYVRTPGQARGAISILGVRPTRRSPRMRGRRGGCPRSRSG